MLEVFKIHYINDDITKKIMIFCGDNEKYHKEHLDQILNKKEFEQLEKNNVEIVFVNDYIHKDDTIENIKLKIIKYDDSITFEEIYLFGNQLKNLNIANILKTIETSDYDENILIYNIKSNIDDDIFNKFLDFDSSEQMHIKDILYIENEKILVKVPIGQKFNCENYIFYNSVSPFDIKTEKNILNNKVIRTNGDFLFEYDIFNNDIYLCKFSEKNILKKIVELYYYYLYEQNIFDTESYDSNFTKLKSSSLKLVSNKAKYNESINEIYKNYSDVEFKKYVSQMGITSIKLKIFSVNNMFVPLDLIFKSLHSTEEFPLLKLNLGPKIEKLFRIYSKGTSIDGRKIPYLKKSEIAKIQRSIGNHKGLTIYIIVKKMAYFIELRNNGDMFIFYENEKHITMDKLNKLFQYGINKILTVIKNKFEKNGYKINFFTDIYSSNISILDCNYIYNLNTSSKIKLKKGNCLSNIFEIKSNTAMLFKKVKNYNELNEDDGFKITVEKAKGIKCGRCWKILESKCSRENCPIK